MSHLVELVQKNVLNFSSTYCEKLRGQCMPTSSKLRTIAPLNVFMLSTTLAYGATAGNPTRELFVRKIDLDETKLVGAKNAYEDLLCLLRLCGFTLSTEIAHASKNKPIDGFKWAKDKLMISFKQSASAQEYAVSVHSKLSFRAIWREPFKVRDTELLDFHQLKDGTKDKKVLMMRRDGSYRSAVFDDLKAKFIEIPLLQQFGDYDLSMFVIVMTKEYPDDEQTFLRTISTMDLKKLYSSPATPILMRVILPKMSAESARRQVYCDELSGEGATYLCTDNAKECKDKVFPTDGGGFESMFSKVMLMKTFVSVSAVIGENNPVDSRRRRRRAAARAPADGGAAPAPAAADPTPPVFRVDRPYVMTIIAKKIDSDPIPLLTMQITGEELDKGEKKKVSSSDSNVSGSCVVI
ncbi:uncharacterized protein [Venturia canescens]|uniref:uncharacterized protein n=1 Tax=Venturia canescens TaxID=32260 RepID=UPI001C9D4EEB|nr:uncharacterized protein LOC122418214 [Venturia canescens]